MEILTSLENKLILLCLILIILVGFFLRFYQLEQRMWFIDSGDHARDFLVAQHLSKFGERVSFGPISAFGIPNAPTYFYFLSLFVPLNDSPFFLVKLLAALNTLSIFLIFLIGWMLFPRAKSALTAALLFAFSQEMVGYSRAIWQPFFCLPFFIISLLLLIIFSQKDKAIFLICSLLVFIFTTQIHFSALAVLPFFVFWSYVFVLQEAKEKFKRAVALTFIWIILIGLFYFPYLDNLKKQFGPRFAKSIFQVDLTIFNVISSSLVAFYYFFQTIFPFSSQLFPLVFGLLLIYALIKSFNEKKAILGIYFCLSFFFVFFFSVFTIIGPQRTHYFTPLYPIFFLILGQSFQFSFSKDFFYRFLKWSLVLCLVIINLKRLSFLKNPPRNDYKKGEMMVKMIETEVKKKDLKGFDIFVSRPNEWKNWNSPFVWFFLEKSFKKKLVKIVSFDTNIEPINKGEFLFLVCQDYSDRKEAESNCLLSFLTQKREYQFLEYLGFSEPFNLYLIKKIKKEA